MAEKLFVLFIRFWQKKVDTGEVSGLSALEILTISCFIGWLVENFVITERKD